VKSVSNGNRGGISRRRRRVGVVRQLVMSSFTAAYRAGRWRLRCAKPRVRVSSSASRGRLGNSTGRRIWALDERVECADEDADGVEGGSVAVELFPEAIDGVLDPRPSAWPRSATSFNMQPS